MEKKRQAKCPKCGKSGGLVARKDAFVNHPIPANGEVDWEDMSDVSTYDHTVYECMDCSETLELAEIEEANNFTIK